MLFCPDTPELSAMEHCAFNDSHATARGKHDRVDQTTISLNDLLVRFNAPAKIDFISLDTEGSEIDILSTFDFDRYDVGLWAIEHNFTSAEEELDRIMAGHGYERVERDWSQWDGWYRKRSKV